MSCRLSLLGPPVLLDGESRPIPVPAKTFALVAYIVLGGGAPASRTALRQFLWPSADAKTAAANMRKFLLRVRERQEHFGFELIRCERNHVELSPTAEIDLARFLKIVAAPGSADIISLCELYRGDLLESTAWEEAEAIEWLEMRRTKLRDAFVGVVAGRLEPIEPTSDRILLRMAARRLVEIDPYNETGHRALMILYSEAGEPARVRDLYRNLERRLHAELKVAPDTVTTELFHSLVPSRATATPAIVKSGAALLQPMATVEPTLHRLDPAPAGTIADGIGAPKVTILPPLTVGNGDFRQQTAVSLIEDVTINLCRSRSLSVVAPHTAWELSISGKKSLFSQFGIDYSVETQLQSRVGEPWLSVRLLEATSRRILWTEQYDLNRAQTAQSYRSLSIQILSSFVERIERTELSRYDAEQSPTAYHLYLVGQRFLRTLDLPNIRRGRRAFKSALSIAPDFVPAITSHARTHQLEWLLLARPENELLSEAEALARRAIEIDPDDARGYRELGISNLYSGRFDESLRALALAEQRNPQFADLLMDHSDALLHAGEAEAALQKLSQAIEMNPLCPDTYWWAAAGANYQLTRYQSAVDCLSRMHDQSPVYRLLAASWAMLGEREKAREYVRRTRDIHPDFSVSGLLSLIPFRDPRYAKHYENGLREAGFD